MVFFLRTRPILALSTLYLSFSTGLSCPGPDCEAIYKPLEAPVYVTTAKPCDECHAEETAAQLTITSHRCTTTASIIPYTSGSSTFWVSTPSCPSPPAVTSWLSQNATCAEAQSCGPVSTVWQNITIRGGLSTVVLPVTYTSYASGSPPATLTLPATTVSQGFCSPSEIHYPGSTIFETTTQLTTVFSTVFKTATQYSSFAGPTVVSSYEYVTTLPGETQVITYTRPGETLTITPSPSTQTIVLTTNGATVTSTIPASLVTYTSIQAPSYYTVTTSIDALTLVTTLPAPTQTVVQTQYISITQTLPAEYRTVVTSLPAYTETTYLAASTYTSVLAASYFTETRTLDALTLTQTLPVETVRETQAASTQFITQTAPPITQTITESQQGPVQVVTESLNGSTYYETTTISLDAITRTLTETSFGLSLSPIETTITVTSYPYASTDTTLSFVYGTITATEIAPQTQTLLTTITETSTEAAIGYAQTITTTITETSYPFASTETSLSIVYATITSTEPGIGSTQTLVTTITLTSTEPGGVQTEFATTIALETAFVTEITSAPAQTTTLTVTSTEAGSLIIETTTATATATETTISENVSTAVSTAPPEISTETFTSVQTITQLLTVTETGSASCDILSSSTDSASLVQYPAATTTTTTTSSSFTASASACATPVGQFAIQIANTNLYLSGESGGIAPTGNTDQSLVTTGDFSQAVFFTAASSANGQVTLLSADGTTLFSDQDRLLGSGDGPIYFDDYSTYSNGDFSPVQFCLQPDNTFVVQNQLGTTDTTDDANIVQICPDSILYLYDAARASSSTCNTVQLQIAQAPAGPPVYPNPTTTTTTTTSPSPTAPSASACDPVPNGQQFRVRLASNSNYLTGHTGRIAPSSNKDQQLTTTPNVNEAIPFEAAAGRNGQITLLSADGTALYSDQDTGASGDGPIYFDDLPTYTNSVYNPVQFCLQPDNSFVVFNPGNDKQDPADDANVVAICSDGLVHLYTEANFILAVSRDGCVRDGLVIDRI